VKSVYDEQDQMVTELAVTSQRPARKWTTPTAKGWTDAVMRLVASQARVFDEELTRLSKRIRSASKRAVWAPTAAEAQEADDELEEVFDAFNDRAAAILPSLYRADD
jgi:hypothetical protein